MLFLLEKMKISNGIKQEYNYKNTYKMIYKQIKEEIKNVVINRYINQIDYLTKKLEMLKNENNLLKNDLIYILKRVLLSKNEYKNTSNNQNSNIHKLSQQRNCFSSIGLNSASYLNNKSNISFFSSGDTINNENNNYTNYRNINYSINKNPNEKRRYSIDDDFKRGNNTSMSPLETSKQMNINNKINYYLNSLYKHNFAEECVTGTASNHLLNKNQSIYDELFINKFSPKKNNVIQHSNTDFNYKKISNLQGRTNSKKKNFCLVDDNSARNKIKIGKNYKIQKNKTNGFLKVNKKDEIQNLKVKINVINHENNKINNCESKSNINSSTNTYYKSSRFNASKKSSRSRFLVNKF